jgi:hypothetical protein
MKRHLILLIALVFTLALVIPAMAEVDVTGDISKTKDVTVTETIDKVKTVTIDVTVDANLDSATESMSIVNQENIGNSVPGISGEPEWTTKEDYTSGSVNGNIGITLLNQSSGNMNNQGNEVSASVSASPETGGFAEAQASAGQNNDNNYVYEYQYFQASNYEFDLSTNSWYKLDIIENSINGNTGITVVNQSAGNMNNQTSAISLGADLGGAMVALSEADLGQYNTNNYVENHNTATGAMISGSVNGNTGITNVNQSAGNMANQSIVISLSGGL